MSRRGAWGTRYGFYMATIGTAFSLGNLWRFPIVAGANGGGAFVVLYIFCALLVGLPVLIAEIMLGQMTRRSSIAALADVAGSKSRWKWIGYASTAASVLLLSYYAVVSGWVLHFFTRFALSLFDESFVVAGDTLDHLRAQGFWQVALTSVHLLFAVTVVSKGVREGLERWVTFLIPILSFLVVVLFAKAVVFEGALEAFRFVFYPDFSRLDWGSLGDALGHVFFTLSLGFGMMVAFGSYLQEDVHIPTAAFRVTIINLLVSMMAGFLVFTLAFQVGLPVDRGVSLLFESVPAVLTKISGGRWLGTAFFLSLYFAALGASMGLLEVTVSNLVDRKPMSRTKAAWSSGGVVLLLSLIPSWGTIQGVDLLQAFDTALINWTLPVLVVGVGLVVGFKIKPQARRMIFVDQDAQSSVVLFPYWLAVLRWGLPIIVLLALGAQMFQFFSR